MTTTAKYKRRTFKDVAADAYAKGYTEGRAQGRKDVEKDYNALLVTNMEMGRTITKLSNISLRKLAWSRITGLFRNRDDRMA